MTLSDAVRSRAAQIQVAVLDVDGVLTDGSLWYGEQGEQAKRFHVRDGMGIRMLRHFGLHVAVISARASKLVKPRMTDLGIAHWVTGQDDKAHALDQLAAQLGIGCESMAFLGDDILDVPALRKVGLGVAVADAHPCAKASSAWITQAPGGEGAVRELADALLEAHFGLERAYEDFLTAISAARG